MAMILSEYMMHKFSPSPVDLYRNGAAVISGIGFIGAGTIITTRSNQVRSMIKGDGPVATVTVKLSSYRDREKIMTILQTCSGISFYEIL
jgi:hypothetical protein